MPSFDVRRIYNAQSQHESSEMLDVPAILAAESSIDAWRHRRMLDVSLSFVRAFPNATWLTVGDGRYGSDAAFLGKQGASAVASSITDTTLQQAKQAGFIAEYRVENAEHLSLADDSVSFVLCKESYHHFPRPPIALYEMLRVATHAVILIEPMEEKARILDKLKVMAKSLLGRETMVFEPSGNFLYRLNPRELGKLLCAINQSGFALRRMNDCYMPQLGSANAIGTWAGWMSRRMVNVQDVLCRLKLLSWGMGAFVIFKNEPGSELLAAAERGGFNVVRLPANPYIKGS
jgi:SAM-dependent methyltransferase